MYFIIPTVKSLSNDDGIFILMYFYSHVSLVLLQITPSLSLQDPIAVSSRCSSWVNWISVPSFVVSSGSDSSSGSSSSSSGSSIRRTIITVLLAYCYYCWCCCCCCYCYCLVDVLLLVPYVIIRVIHFILFVPFLLFLFLFHFLYCVEM